MNNDSKNAPNSQKLVVSVNLVVYNGERYIRQCLDAVKKQMCQNIEVNIWDNRSTDGTLGIIENEYKGFKLFKSSKNLGMWPAHEELWKISHGEFIVVLSVDVILDSDFVKNAVEHFVKDEKIGVLQAKIYQWHFGPDNQSIFTKTIDTAGFKIFKSRRIINIGHGEKDEGQFDRYRLAKTIDEVFAVEGAVPIFRRKALEDCRLKSQGNKIIDPDFFWYGDDLDLAWRMRLFGWKQIYAPTVIAYHDRKTTKVLANSWQEFVKIRKIVPMFKRRLDWRNTTLAIIKNDFAANLMRDLPFIFWRQLRLWGYFLLFEASMILEIFRVAKMLPKMLKRRGEIMKKARVSAREMRRWFV